MIDNIFLTGIAGSVQFCLSVADKPEGNIRVGQSEALHQITDVISLCLGRL